MPQTEEISANPDAGGVSSGTGTAMYDQARQRLQSARGTLSRAIKEYLSASQFIQTTCSATPHFPNELLARREALLAIDAELSTFLLEKTSIQEAHEILTDTRNRSKMVAPIYSLPSEILARIFSEAACNCTHVTTYDPVPPALSPVILSAVCRQWRIVAIGHQALWTHLDFDIPQSYTNHGWSPPKIWMEHSQGAPLFVTIRHCVLSGDGDTDSLPPVSMVARLLAFLVSLMRQLSSLTLILGWPLIDMTEMLLDYWATYGAPGRAKVLKIKSNPEHGLLGIFPPIQIPAQTHSLESLEVLHAYNAVPPWSNWTFSNLTDLQLEADLLDGSWSMTQSELVSVLEPCPKLQYLTLNGLEVQGSQGPTPNAVILNELRVLDIGCINTSVLVAVLDVINPGDIELRLEIALFYTCINTHEALPAVRLFANRANIDTLRWACYGEPCFASQLGPLPRVRTLAINLCYFSDVARAPSANQGLKTYVNQIQTDSQTVLWPDLQELDLHSCVLEKEHLYRLISLHSIQTLHLLGCFQCRQTGEKSRLGRQARQEYMELLSGVVTGDCVVQK